VDKIRELRQVALIAFKSQEQMTEIPCKDTDDDAFMEWTAKMQRALQPILCEVCSDTYTMFKIQHPNYGNGVRDFKWKWWHNTDAKRKEDAKRKANAKHDANAPHKKVEKEQPKKDKKDKKESKKKKYKKAD